MTVDYIHPCRRVAIAPTETRRQKAEIGINQPGGWVRVFIAKTGGVE
jgi:hypothetical protein